MRLRTRLATAGASLLLALSGTLVVAGPASAATYGYIAYSNNCGSARTLWIVYKGGANADKYVTYQASAPNGWKGTFKVPSAQKYSVRAFPSDKVVTIYNFAGRVHNVAVKAC
ncbi:hypothetical protein ACWDV4_11765 [Micromonospora sp. NPDC003197]